MRRKSALILLFFHFFISMLLFAQTRPDSLLKALAGATGDNRVKTLNELRKHYKNRDPEKALDYARQALAEAERGKNKQLTATVLNDMSIVFLMMQKNDSAEELLLKSLTIYESIKDSAGIAKVTNNLGITYNQTGRYPDALEFYTRAVRFYERQPDKSNLARVYLSLGLVYEKLNKLPDALHYLKLARNYGEISHNEKLVADARLNIGLSYKTMGLTDSAQLLFNQSLKFYQAAGALYETAMTFTNLAQLYMDMNNFAMSLKYFHMALPIVRKMKNEWAEATIFIDMGELFYKKGIDDSATVYLNSSLRLLESCQDVSLSQNAHHLLYSVYKSSGDYNNALKHHELYKIMADSAMKLKNYKVLEEINARFQSREKDAEYQLLLKSSKLKEQRHWMLAGGLLLILFASLTGILVLHNRKTKLSLAKEMADKHNEILSHENRLRESEVREMKLEKELHEEEMQKVRMELQLKEQDIVFQTLCKLDREMLSKSVVSKLSPFQHLFARKKDQEDFVKALQSINQDAVRDPMSDFELTFTNLHRGFYEKLLQRFPALTKQEMTICALLRLNLNSKDISGLLNLSLNTIDVTRHHIRKKLNLDQKESLTAFLIMI